jgi:hypothetical protein
MRSRPVDNLCTSWDYPVPAELELLVARQGATLKASLERLPLALGDFILAYGRPEDAPAAECWQIRHSFRELSSIRNSGFNSRLTSKSLRYHAQCAVRSAKPLHHRRVLRRARRETDDHSRCRINNGAWSPTSRWSKGFLKINANQ